MTHQPPVPPAATPPYPPQPAPHEKAPNAPTKVAATSAEVAKGLSVTGRAIAVGAAVGIGSAAIAAALLFAGSRSRS